MATNFDFRRKIRVSDKRYADALEKRGLKHAIVHETAEFRYPTAKEISTLQLERHVWSTSDDLANLAFEHYGNVNHWKIIAFFNKRPSQALIKPGTILFIPKPLQSVLQIIRL